jgi:uncharacterized membrane protein
MPRDEDLRRWLAAGLIDQATAGRIAAFEAARERERARERAPGGGRPGVLELLIYLAAAITAAGITVLFATNWEHLASPLRVAVPAAAAVAVFAAGAGLRGSNSDAMVRGASLLWLLAGGLAVATAAIASHEAGFSENDVALTAGIVAVAASIALWAPMRMHPQIAGMAGAAFLFSTALGSRAAEDWIVPVIGTSLAAFGLAAMAATEYGALTPRISARLLAAAGLGFGGFFAGMPPAPAVAELLAAAAVVVLVGVGMWRQSLVYVGFGVATAFAGMLTLILRHVESPTLAGLALVAIGLALLGAIWAMRELRPWARWGALSPGEEARG